MGWLGEFLDRKVLCGLDLLVKVGGEWIAGYKWMFVAGPRSPRKKGGMIGNSYRVRERCQLRTIRLFSRKVAPACGESE